MTLSEIKDYLVDHDMGGQWYSKRPTTQVPLLA